MNRSNQDTESTTVVIFGASGDLTQRKLVPALFSLYRKKRVPFDIRIVGFARRPFTHEEFRSVLCEGLKQFADKSFDSTTWEDFVTHIWYVQGDFNTSADYKKLQNFLRDSEGHEAHRLYHMATAPNFYPVIVDHLGRLDMARETDHWQRLIVEKPFGYDLSSARILNQAIHSVFKENQVYRIDHYLGKETAQNILFFRFGNTIFEPVWNRNFIDHVQITVAEKVDVGHRAGYYDQAGVFRDMFQNHLLQLLALTTMEPPASFEADAIRSEKVKLLSAIRPIPRKAVAGSVVRGQYLGYREADSVEPNSQTATYAALRLYIDNWRWQGVPFYLRSGKALAGRTSHIAIQFRCPPHVMFPLPAGQGIRPNLLVLCIQPDEGMHLRFEVKVPETFSETRSADMAFHYDDVFGPSSMPDAYERLLLDALNGDASLFTRSDGIEMAWRFIDSIIQGCEEPYAPALTVYEPGSWGPKESDDFMARDGRCWYQGCKHEGE